MTEFSLPFGKTQLSFTIPSIFKTDLLSPEPVQPMDDPIKAIQVALEQPANKRKLQSLSSTATIGIAINDKTRPIPQPNPIGLLLDYLLSLGFEKNKITLFVGSGTHQPMQESELSMILSEEIVKNYRVVIHDCDHSPMVDLGYTAHNTPIRINADYMNCDLKITSGNIEPHHFMGFSGGIKTAMIGLADRETINRNHAMLTHPQAKTGVYHINPMRQDIEEMGKKAKIQFSLGTVLNEQKQILNVFFGDPIAVMKSAIPVVQQIFGVRVPQKYDLVVASPGGYPKDINLYQAQKGLTHATRIARDGWWVILLAACTEGSGSPSFETFIKESRSHQAIIREFQEGFFEVGPHKAFQIARDAVRVNIVLVSEISPKIVKEWKLTPSTPELLQPLVDWIAARLTPDARIAILPASTRTMTEVNFGSE